MSHRSRFYVAQKSRKSQKDICHTETTEITERYIYVPYVTQKPRKSQKDIFMSRLILCHTEITEITERYIYVPIDFMSHRNHGNHRNIFLSHGNHRNHRKIYVTQKPRKSQKYIYVAQKPWKSQKDIFLRDFKASRFLCEKNFSVISVISV